MKADKTLIIILTALLAVTSLLVSCNSEVASNAGGGDKLVYATFGNTSKAIRPEESTMTQSYSVDNIEDVYWVYTATKDDAYGIHGQQTSDKRVNSGKGLSGAIGPFSKGYWNFTVKGYKFIGNSTEPANPSVDQLAGDNYSLIFVGSVSHFLLNTDNIDQNPAPIPVTVYLQTEGGAGTLTVKDDFKFFWKEKNAVSGEEGDLKLKIYLDDSTTASITADLTAFDDSEGVDYYKLASSTTKSNSNIAAGDHNLKAKVVKVIDENTELVFFEGTLPVKIYSGQTTEVDMSLVKGSFVWGQFNGTLNLSSVVVTTNTSETFAEIAFSDEIGLSNSLSSNLIKEISISDVNNPNVDLWDDNSHARSLCVPSGSYIVHIGLSDKEGTFGSLNGILSVTAGTKATINQDIQGAYYNWRTAFGYKEDGNLASGLKSFTDSTTYTYKYILNGDVVPGETVTEDNTLRYWLHVPFNYDRTKTYPVMVYIHGSGGCLYYQNSSPGGGQVLYGGNGSDFINQNSMSWMNLLSSTSSVYVGINSEEKIFKNMAVGESSNVFISAWFDHVKANPEDDCFFIVPNLNDEMWFENRATYSIYEDNGVYKIDYDNSHQSYQAKLLDIRNAFTAGNDYGSTLPENSAFSNYNITYKTSQTDMNVWFQLMIKLEDKIVETYRNGRPASDYKHYVVGGSLGGVAVYDLIVREPKRYAGAIAYGAAGADLSSENLGRITAKVLALHSTIDGLVSSASSEAFIEALNTARHNEKAKLVTTSAHGHWPPGSGPTVFRDQFELAIREVLYGAE